MRETGRVDGALVGVDNQKGQTLYRALIPDQKTQIRVLPASYSSSFVCCIFLNLIHGKYKANNIICIIIFSIA